MFGLFLRVEALARLVPAQKTSPSTQSNIATIASRSLVEPTVTLETLWSRANPDWSAYLSATGL